MPRNCCPPWAENQNHMTYLLSKVKSNFYQTEVPAAALQSVFTERFWCDLIVIRLLTVRQDGR